MPNKHVSVNWGTTKNFCSTISALSSKLILNLYTPKISILSPHMLRRLSLLFILFCFTSFLSLLKKYSETALTEAPVSIKAYMKILSIFTGT
jgi:hypothetical protein